MKKIVIIDNEVLSINCIRNAIDLYVDNAQVIGTASNIEEGIICINNEKPDIVILDIDLGTGTGFDLLNAFKSRNFDVIFVTAYANYAIKAFKVSAIDFLLKPFEISELKEAINKTYRINNTSLGNINSSMIKKNSNEFNNYRIALPYQFGYEFLDTNDIFYLVADGNYVNIIHKKGKPDYVISKPLTYFENMLNNYIFLRTHNSYIVNMMEVKSYIRGDGGSLIINNGAKVPVSRKNKQSVLERIYAEYKW